MTYTEDLYFEWLYIIISDDKKYRRLLIELHSIEFTYILPMDKNRALDGLQLRYYFQLDTGQDASMINGPCSVLEMIIALSMACENIMDDPLYGNRTKQWFWIMINNLGLSSMIGNLFDRNYIHEKIDTFLKREYSPNGKGGLFILKRTNEDLRNVEIWHQLCWFLNEFIGY